MNTEKNNIQQSPAIIRFDDIYPKSPFLEAAEFFRSRMITGQNLKAALLSFLVIMSAKLQRPLNLMLAMNDPSVGVNLLKQCMMITPGEMYEEYGTFRKRENIFPYLENRQKTLINFDPSVKVHELEVMVEQWKYHEFIRDGYSHSCVNQVGTNYGPIRTSSVVSYLLSFIGITNSMTDEKYDHPAILKIPVTCDENGSSGHLAPVDNQPLAWEEEMKIARLRKSLARLRPMSFGSSYVGELLDHLTLYTTATRTMLVMPVLLKIMALCCIVNNREPLSRVEISQFYNMGMKGDETDYEPNIFLTKVDYYHMWLLLDGMLPAKSDERQGDVFEALKHVNLLKLGDNQIKDKPDTQLLQISESRCWARSEEILHVLQMTGHGDFSESSVTNILGWLTKRGLIAKGPEESSQGGYYITTFTMEDTIRLPRPSEFSEEGLIQVINPLTGMEETI